MSEKQGLTWRVQVLDAQQTSVHQAVPIGAQAEAVAILHRFGLALGCLDLIHGGGVHLCSREHSIAQHLRKHCSLGQRSLGSMAQPHLPLCSCCGFRIFRRSRHVRRRVRRQACTHEGAAMCHRVCVLFVGISTMPSLADRAFRPWRHPTETDSAALGSPSREVLVGSVLGDVLLKVR